jgi:hypothetical protein
MSWDAHDIMKIQKSRNVFEIFNIPVGVIF